MSAFALLGNRPAYQRNLDAQAEALARGRQAGLGGLGAPVYDRRGVANAAFARWFGNSIVVNADGSPRVVFHGTMAPEGFDVFKEPTSELGFHFGTLEQASKFVADRTIEMKRASAARSGFVDPWKPRIYAVYLSIQQPLALGDLGDWTAFSVGEALRAARIISLSEHERVMKAWDTLESNAQTKALAIVKHYLDRDGYDGIVYDNDAEGPGESYLVWHPEQVKSAVGNRGTYRRDAAEIYA